MQLRSLSTYLKTRKALRKYNAQVSFQITPQRLCNLLIIYNLQRTGRSTGNKAVFKGQTDLGLGLSWQHIMRHNKELTEAGLLEKDGHNTVLTVKGHAVLQRINTILGRQRLDA